MCKARLVTSLVTIMSLAHNSLPALPQGKSNQILSHLLARQPPLWQRGKAWHVERERTRLEQAAADGGSSIFEDVQPSNRFGSTAHVEQRELHDQTQLQQMQQ
jgi:hypothetical protein